MAVIYTPKAGASVVEVIKYAQEPTPTDGPPSPPPYGVSCDMFFSPLSPGERVWVEVNLKPSTYVVGSPMPDQAAMAAGKPPANQAALGLIKAFSVK